MKDLSLHDLSARVVAWHNRHPLARRVTTANVHSVGYVVLPYLAGLGASAAAAARPATATATATATHVGAVPSSAPLPTAQPAPTRATLEPAFSEDFIEPLLPSQVARWAALHGVALASPRADAPVRQVVPTAGADLTRLHPLWVLTAQLEVGRSRSRVLVGAGDAPAVLGRRMWSSARIAGLVALLAVVAVLVAGAMALRRGQAAPANAVPAVAAAASRALVASAIVMTASASVDRPASSPMPLASSPTASAVEAARPAAVQLTLGRVVLPPIGPGIDERRRAAELSRQQAMPAPDAAASAPARAAVGPAFAVSTRLLRTRTESDQTAAAMRALLVTAATPQMNVEVMPAGNDWRVVGWPYADRAQAEKARALLVGRGMKVEVIDF